MKKTAARKTTSTRIPQKSNSSFFSQLFHSKHRHAHGFALGTVLVLMQGIWYVFAIGGVLLMIVSVVLFLFKSSKATR